MKTWLLIIIWVCGIPRSYGQINVNLVNEYFLAPDGLYFEGTKGVDYQFGKQITPHGDCIDVINGYVFVTWYKGGMDKRNLMVSRKKIDGGEWKTIEFPDRHIGYRGNPTIGDSHNTAAIIICPIDGTIHLLYDMHAYSKTDFPNNYFNYRVSKKNGAFVPDEQWTLENFSPKQHFLKDGINYEKSTYPGFLRFDDGRILVELRFGGSGNGNDMLAIYDGTSWSENIQYNNGNQPGDGKYSIYGSYQYLHGKLIAGYSIRYSIANAGTHPLYELNNGFFYSEASPPYQKNDWKDLTGNPITLPVQDPNFLKLVEPCAIGIGNRISMGPIWTVTKNGAMHILTNVSGKDVHFYKKPGNSTFYHSLDAPDANGDFFDFGTTIFNVALENGRVVMQTTPEGENKWETVYRQTGGDTYRHFRAYMSGDKLFLYLMKTGSGDAQPLTLITYSISNNIPSKTKIQKSSSLKILPNPASDKVMVSGISEPGKIQLYNILGRLIAEVENDQHKNEVALTVSELKNGLYFLKSGNQIIKLVKEQTEGFK